MNFTQGSKLEPEMGPKIFYGTIIDQEIETQVNLNEQIIRNTLRDQFYDSITLNSDEND